MIFDANAARGLTRRSHNLADCLAAMKQAVLHAAQVGEFESTVGLPEALTISAGQSTNSASFLLHFFNQHGYDAWADAVAHALRAGYAVRPSWRSADGGAALDGLTLSWYLVEPQDAPDATLLLMPAATAHAMSQGEQVHQRWVEGLQPAIRQAALQGKPMASVHDALAAADPTWAKRREILQRAGFSTELVAADRGAVLVIRW